MQQSYNKLYNQNQIMFIGTKTSFTERFEKTTRFYDFTYHLHKATFKGLSEFYRSYSKIEKTYSQQLIRLTKNIWSDMPDLRKQNNTLVSTVKQVLFCLETTSQLHFNYGQKLQQIASFYNSEYLGSKKRKENHMKIIKDRNEEQYYNFREKNKTDKEIIAQKEKQIFKSLYDGLQKLADEENDRIQKIKQQSIIYFSVYRKVCDKQLQRVSEQNQKLAKQQFKVRNKGIEQISEQLRAKHNQYEGQKIERRASYDVDRTMKFNRSSLKQSLMIKQRMTKIGDYQSSLKQKIDRYEQLSDQILFVCLNDTDYAIFDSSFFTDVDERRKYSRQINGEFIKAIAYEMFDGFVRIYQEDSDNLMILQLIKASLKFKMLDKFEIQASTIQAFWGQASKKDYQYRWHAKFFQILSQLYQKKCDKAELNDHMKKKSKREDFSVKSSQNLSFLSSTSLINILLDPIYTINSNEEFLSDGYIDFLILISKFSQKFLKIQRGTVILLFLKKLFQLMSQVSRRFSEPLEQILHDKYLIEHKSLNNSSQKLMNTTQWCNNLLNKVTQRLIYFFSFKTPFINYIKILLLIEKLELRKEQHFNAKQHIYISLRCAGYNYLKSSESSNRILSVDQGVSSSIAGQDRLKRLTIALEELQYESVVKQFFQSASKQIATLFGVSQKIAKAKIFEQFTYAALEITKNNLLVISQEEGIDRQGYALRLGVILAKLDLMNPMPITEYDEYFQVLDKYLNATEKDYDTLLEQSRRTQLWIMQDNSLATTNCIDFCSLLYKPFQFLLISLNKLQNSEQTRYTLKYSQFIKSRLNKELKNQILKYINFLYDSLESYSHTGPELKLKVRRREKPNALSRQSIQQDKNSFKQITRRMFNLLFLKDQLEEMMCDFLDQNIYKKLDHSIFNVDLLTKNAGEPGYQQILKNIKDIVETVLAYEQKIVKRASNICIFQYFRPIFENLYYQQQKNALEQFFTSQPSKLSEFTFVRMQQSLEQWLMIIAKNVPDQFITLFSEQFASAFFQALRYEILNPNKFKIPIKSQKLIPYLEKDVVFITKMMKQKFFNPQKIDQKILKPFQKVLTDLQSDTAKLTGSFENATLKNDEQKRRYILCVLNLRVKDQKALDFVKNYRPRDYK